MDPLTVFLANRKHAANLFIVFLTMGIFGLWASAVPAGETTGGSIPAPREGFLAPGFELETLQAGQLSLDYFKGQVVLINLWASWCPPCRAEMPAIQRVYEEFQDQGLVVLAVNMTSQDSSSEAAAFVQEFGLTFPVLLDRTGKVGNLYRMRALPSTFLVDREGVIQRVIVGGPISELTLQSMVSEVIVSQP